MQIMHTQSMPGVGPPPFPGDLVEHLRAVSVLAKRLEADPKGAYDAAARELRVDPSVLRRRVSALAAWLDTPLFEGRGARLGPTAVGRAAIETALRVLGDLERLASGAGAERERVSIGCTGTITRELLPAALGTVMRAHPDTELHVRRAGTADALGLLASGELDVAVVRGSRPPGGVTATRLVPDRLWLAAARGAPLARKKRLTARDLAAARIVTYGSGSFTRARVMGALAPLGAAVAIEVDGRAAALGFVREGLGIAFVSRIPGAPGAAPGIVWRNVDALFAPASFWLAWRADRPPRGAARELTDALSDRARELRQDATTRPR